MAEIVDKELIDTIIIHNEDRAMVLQAQLDETKAELADAKETIGALSDKPLWDECGNAFLVKCRKELRETKAERDKLRAEAAYFRGAFKGALEYAGRMREVIEKDEAEPTNYKEDMDKAIALDDVETALLRDELAEAIERHRIYSCDIADAIGPNRKRRDTGEIAKPDAYEIRRLKADLDHYKSVLEEMANDGCGLLYKTGDGSRADCRVHNPNDKSEWCWCCIARKALEECFGGKDDE